MVSFWPFKGDDKSAAGFEKVLSTLSNKINKISATDARLRQNQRRVRVLWTLYTCFAYVLAALILILVTGRENMNSIEWSGLAGGPVAIYGVRLTIDAYFNYRLSGTSTSLSDLQKQREDAIEKLKAATKYNSTQQLLDKYGGSASPTPPPKKGQQQSLSAQQQQSPTQPRMQGRTGLPPPPTANIAKRPQQPALTQGYGDHAAQVQPTEEFAPNAYSAAPSTSTGPATHPVTSAAPEYAPSGPSGPKWYDRILDVVLGEDETAPKNRIVLICEHCRLVNGQAPPGTRAVEELGKWRCMGCGTMNGAESEVSRVVRQVRRGGDVRELDESERKGGRIIDDESVDDDAAPEVDDDEDISEDMTADTPPAGSTRSKARQRRK